MMYNIIQLIMSKIEHAEKIDGFVVFDGTENEMM